MSNLFIILSSIVFVNIIFITHFIRDLIKHREDLQNDPANNILLTFSSMTIFFFSSFGICDFAISTLFYRIKKLVSDKKLSGTLNTQCVIPVAVMAFAFIASIQVDMTTLIVCILSQVLGAYIGPRFVIKLSVHFIRKMIAIGLLLAGLIILAGKFHYLPVGGMATELHGIKLTIAAMCLFLFGALNNVGVGSYPLTMTTIYALGMSPLVSFPIMMGACAFSTSTSGMQFIKHNQYSRKITLFTSTFGVIGVLFAVYFIKTLNISWLQWVIVAVLFYASINMLLTEFNIKLFKLKNPIFNL